jgi:signal transduction histidine kinase
MRDDHTGPARAGRAAAEDVTAQELRALVGRLFRAQENERHDLARELHDDISQRLARLEMDVHDFERSLATGQQVDRQRLGEIREAIGSASAVIRAISHRLYPSIVEDLGLGPALRSLAEDSPQNERISVTYSEENVPDPVRPEVATPLYRIAEEALRNVEQHAGKARVTITLQGSQAGLRLAIADSGRGFNLAERRSAFGLMAMEERAREVGATFRIESKPGAGTRVIVELPAAALT